MRVFTLISGLMFCVAGAAAPAWAQDEAGMLASLRSLMDEASCSAGAQDRAEELERLVAEGRLPGGEGEEAMLREVNRFYYRHIRMKPDIQAWGWEDYWATPAETLCRGDGDTEDFAIAKYFTLAWIGVPEDRLRLVYATSEAFGPLIVLLYYTSDGEVRILSHQDLWTLEEVTAENLLQPVYAFDTETFWLASSNWQFARMRDAQRIQQWRRVMQEMN